MSNLVWVDFTAKNRLLNWTCENRDVQVKYVKSQDVNELAWIWKGMSDHCQLVQVFHF